jgi:ABC-type polysaccharide/polyol phosphate export permease
LLLVAISIASGAGGVLFALVGTIIYFHVVQKLQSIGIQSKTLVTPNGLLRTIRHYRHVATENSWPLWLVPLFWASAIGTFVLAIAHFCFLQQLLHSMAN